MTRTYRERINRPAKRQWWGGCGMGHRRLRPPLPYRDAGLTLVECLVALTTVTLTGALVGPPLLIASATQLQTRRIQQAQHLAQAEVDRVWTAVQQASDGSEGVNLPPVSHNGGADQSPPQAIAAIRSSYNHCHSDNAVTQPNQGIGIDLDGDAACSPEFVLQSFRTRPSPTSPQMPLASGAPVDVVVRVYAAPKGSAPHELQSDLAPIQLTQAIDSRRPLAVVMTTVVPQHPTALLCYHNQPCLP
ncbi:MAG: hypothetical protein WBA10_20770 [Elainellaceae cyanobacterium]